jgi:hypothetical protein
VVGVDLLPEAAVLRAVDDEVRRDAAERLGQHQRRAAVQVAHGLRVRGSTGIVPRRKSSPHSVNSMPRCGAAAPGWRWRPRSSVVPNQMAI